MKGHVRSMLTKPSDSSGAALRLSQQISIDQWPLLCFDPRHTVPVPLHILLGVTIRLFRRAVEIVILCKSSAVGWIYADQLAVNLRIAVRVVPTSYHGGVLIGRDCNTLAQKCDVVCATLLTIVPKRNFDAYSWA